MNSDFVAPALRIECMNIFHIVLEDFSTLALALDDSSGGATADASMPSTPHMARLATKSTVFRRAFCQAPICNPSRTSFMTGRRPSATKVFTNDHPYRDYVPQGTPTLVDFLRAAAPDAAIACASGSKLFHIACDKDAMSMDAAYIPLPADIPENVRRAAAFVLNPTGPHSYDNFRAKVAISRLLRYRRDSRRFYLGVGLVETHVQPHRPDNRICHTDVVPHALRRPSASAPPSRSSERLPPLVTWTNYDFWRAAKTQEQRRAIGLYYSCASHVDGTVGALVGALDALNLTATTAVVVQGDHGFSLGAHGRWSKYNLFEDATRVPLIIRVPGGQRQVIDDVVESVDVLPTFLDLWGVPHQPQRHAERAAVRRRLLQTTRRHYSTGLGLAPALRESLPRRSYLARSVPMPLDGESLMPYLNARSQYRRHRRYARSELHLPCGLGCVMLNQPYDGLPPGFSRTPHVGPVVMLYVRSRRWSYTATFRGLLHAMEAPRLIDESLFDMHADPGEASNLAYYPAYATQRGMLLHTVLRDWGVTPSGPINESRWQRAEWLRNLTGFRRDWWKRN